MKILLVEPDEYYHTQFSQHLGDLGDLIIAPTADQALESLRVATPDLLIMELLLPDRGGHELLRRIREEKRLADLPVIIFSGMEHVDDIQAVLNLGAVAYFVKGKDTLTDVKRLLLNYAL